MRLSYVIIESSSHLLKDGKSCMQVTRDVCEKRYMGGIRRGVHVSEIGRSKSKNSFVES